MVDGILRKINEDTTKKGIAATLNLNSYFLSNRILKRRNFAL